jgi:uncharacterized membrane protein YgdD (TMEM256/DUF423 family)
MQKFFLSIGSLLGAMAVIFGAFGAHALKARIGTDQLAVFETGVKYQFYHTLAILLVAFLSEKNENPALAWAGYLFITGIVLFSGSLYLLSTRTLFQANLTWLGPVTPLGGMAFIAGWILLFIFSLKKQAI